MSGRADPGRTVFRPVRARAVVYVCAAAVLVTLVTLAVVLPSGGPHPWGPWSRLGVVLFALLAVFVLHRLASVRVETSDDGIEKARQDGAEVLVGNAADPEILTAANVVGAKRLFVTIPEPFEAGQAVEQARAANPTLDILARAHSNAAVEHLNKLGANLVVLGESEIADRMVERAQGKNGPS